MTILFQAFFALVRGHLVAFTFFSAWHDCYELMIRLNCGFLIY